MSRKVVNLSRTTQKLPFSHAIKSKDLIFCSGQIPMDWETGQMIRGDIRVQTRQVLENLKKLLAEAGSSLEKVVKVTVFMTNLNEFQAMNDVYQEFFPLDPPARSTVQVSALAMGAAIEIELIASE